MWIQKNLYCQQLIKNTTLSTGSILIDMYYSSFVSVPILIGGSQSHLSGFFLLCAPKFWEDSGDLQMVLFHSVNADCVVRTLRGGGNTQTIPAVIEFL